MKCMLIKIIYVSHDAHFHGAQLLSLHTIKALKENFDYSVAIIYWIRYFNSRFSKVRSCLLSRARLSNRRKGRIINKDLLSQDFTLAICSTVGGDIVALLARHNIKIVSLIHELPHLIQQYSAEGKLKTSLNLLTKLSSFTIRI